MRRRPLSVPDKPENFEISFNLADLTSTVLIKDRLRGFLDHLGLPEHFSRIFLESFSQWSSGRDFKPEERNVLIHAFLRDGLGEYLKKNGCSDDEIDRALVDLDGIADCSSAQ